MSSLARILLSSTYGRFQPSIRSLPCGRLKTSTPLYGIPVGAVVYPETLWVANYSALVNAVLSNSRKL